MNNSNASTIGFSKGDRQNKDWHYRLNHKLLEALTHYCPIRLGAIREFKT